MKEVMLIKLGEIVLKGLNKKNFEDKLIKNIREKIAEVGEFEIKIMQSTIYLMPQNENDADFAQLEKKISKIFGIARYTRAAWCQKNLDSIKETVAEYLQKELRMAKTIKVESKRIEKKY